MHPRPAGPRSVTDSWPFRRALAVLASVSFLLLASSAGPGTGSTAEAASFTSRATATPSTLAAGASTSIVATVTSSGNATVVVDVEVFNPAGARVFQAYWENERFGNRNLQRSFTAVWQVPADLPTGAYRVAVGVFSANWGSLQHWNNAAATITVTTSNATPPPTPAPTPTPSATPCVGRACPAPTATPTPTPKPSPTATPTPTLAPTPAPTSSPGPGAVSITGLRVQGNQIVNGAGQAVRLRGVNRSGTEYACIQGWGIFDGPSDLASVQAIASWKTNAVRVPLNEDCWLGINGAAAAYSGAAYQQAIAAYVTLLNSAGLVAILELHWSAPGATRATGQQPMPDRDHSLAFWGQVAAAFKGNSSVVFDLFNEPYPDSNRDTTAAWQCWRDGGTCAGVSFQAAGIQELVNAVRATGATNVILLGGVRYSNAMRQWLTYKPSDPLNNLAASWHVYNFNACVTAACFDADIGPLVAQVPLVATEIGEDDCGSAFISTVMNWLDSKRQGYLAWTWDTWGTACSAIALIKDYAGTPTAGYGQGFKDRLAAPVQ